MMIRKLLIINIIIALLSNINIYGQEYFLEKFNLEKIHNSYSVITNDFEDSLILFGKEGLTISKLSSNFYSVDDINVNDLSDIKNIFPVFRDKVTNDTLWSTNEIVVSFRPAYSSFKKWLLETKYNLDLVENKEFYTIYKCKNPLDKLQFISSESNSANLL